MTDSFRLKDTKVYRAPSTGGYWEDAHHGYSPHGEPTEIAASKWTQEKRKSAKVRFDLTYGPGYSSICFSFGASDFEVILKAMARVNRDAALAAAASLLFEELKAE